MPSATATPGRHRQVADTVPRQQERTAGHSKHPASFRSHLDLIDAHHPTSSDHGNPAGTIRNTRETAGNSPAGSACVRLLP